MRRGRSEEGRKIERQRLEAGAGDDRCATRLRRRFVAVDHPTDPVDLAREIELVDARAGAGPMDRLAVTCVRSDEVRHDTTPLDQCIDRRRVRRVGEHDPVGRRTDGREDLVDPDTVPAGDGPGQAEQRRSTREVSSDLSSGDAGRTEQDHVEHRRHASAVPPAGRGEPSGHRACVSGGGPVDVVAAAPDVPERRPPPAREDHGERLRPGRHVHTVAAGRAACRGRTPIE